MNGIPAGQLMSTPYYQSDKWKFLGTFQDKYDLWLRLDVRRPDEGIITIRWREYLRNELAQYGVIVGPPNSAEESLKTAYEVALGRAGIYINGDPSVSPGIRR